MSRTLTPNAKNVTVHLRDVPVDLAVKARQVSEDVLREFALITADVVDQEVPANGHEVPMRLMDLVVSLTQELHEAVDAAARHFDEAVAGGSTTIDDLRFEWPVDVSATRAVADTWDEADAYCWSRERLATFATPADCAAYRRWFFAQVLDQLDGRRPVPWPESAAARGL